MGYLDAIEMANGNGLGPAHQGHPPGAKTLLRPARRCPSRHFVASSSPIPNRRSSNAPLFGTIEDTVVLGLR